MTDFLKAWVDVLAVPLGLVTFVGGFFVALAARAWREGYRAGVKW